MHVGMWGLALIVTVVVSWAMYRYLAPESWKEWTRARVLQAFVIAFYAEMYGFPLTIYFLSRFFGLDVAWTEGGNLWAQLFGTPMAHAVAMIAGYSIVSLVAFPVIVIAYTVLARKEEGQMIEKFGDDYREYARRVPMFVPRSLRYRPEEV